jgi:DNA-binding Lrp family transcriptional regulator
MTTTASLKALTDPNNQKTRWTHRKIIYNALRDCKLTNREIAAKVRLKYEQVWKRTSELHMADMIIIVDEKEEDGQANSIYMINPNPTDTSKIKIKFKDWAKKEYPNIWTEYRTLIHHEL